MSRFRQRQTEAARQAAERRQREDDAPRLLDLVPAVETLSLRVTEKRGDAVLAESKHVRHVVVAHASAQIELPCLDSDCEDGGHDISRDVLAGLRAGKKEFEGDDECRGRRKTTDCDRKVHWVATATYRKEA